MKKFIKLLLIPLLISVIFSLFNLKLHASDLDYIKYYGITVDPVQEDGSLNIQIDIEWLVLDSDSEGPLEWVKIGIPNKYVDNIEAKSSNIKKIRYYSDSGSFIRIDFNKNYYEGQVASFSFSFNQSRMYHLYDDELYYDYNPGYFEEIRVEKCVLKWNKALVKQNNSAKTNYHGDNIYSEDDNYYIYTSALGYSEALKIKMVYDKASFNNISEKMQYSDNYITFKDYIRIVIIILVILAFIGVIYYLNYKNTDPYLRERGFVRYHTFLYFHYPIYYGRTNDSKGARIINPAASSGGSSHGGSGGCACACACACAGGGRAGCSKKDFYHTDLKSDKIIKELERINYEETKRILHRRSK